MKTRNLRLAALTALAVATALALALLAPALAGGVRDTCVDALNNMYNNCWLHFGGNGKELSYPEAYNMCENETNAQQKVCWTSCAKHNTDCGKMAACIDGCFNDSTACSFVVQFVYNLCKWHLTNPVTGAQISYAEADADCQSDTSGLFNCYKNCAYSDWNQCLQMDYCTPKCLADDDNDTGDDVATPTPDPGAPINAHGSACGC
jgi:hypothetical protein